MKKLFLSVIALAMLLTMTAKNDTLVLNINAPLNPGNFTFDSEKGYWTETYNENNYNTIDFANFSFSHSAFADYNYWDGFTVSISSDNSNPHGNYNYQWGNMAGGGIKTDAVGNILFGTNGKPQVEAGIPYMLAYADYPGAAQTIIYGADEPYKAVGMYVNNTAFPYFYNIETGSGTGINKEGGYFKLLIYALDEGYAKTGSPIEYYLAKYENGAIIQSSDWEWVDLSALGDVYGLQYEMESTDNNQFGILTPTYFALDKLTVRTSSGETSVAQIIQAEISVFPNPATTELRIKSEELRVNNVEIFDITGKNVMTLRLCNSTTAIDVRSLQAGTYFLKIGNVVKKFVKE